MISYIDNCNLILFPFNYYSFVHLFISHARKFYLLEKDFVEVGEGWAG